LSRTRQLLDEIATRIDVEEETVAVDTQYFGEIELEEPSSENLLDEISGYFSRPTDGLSDSVASIPLN